METYKIRVVENIGARSEETFGRVGTEIEVRKGALHCYDTYFDSFTDKDGYTWSYFKCFEQLKDMFDDDLDEINNSDFFKYRTRFELV